MKIICPGSITQSKPKQNEIVRGRAKPPSPRSEPHAFGWNGNGAVATCSCGGWTLWGASLASAKRTHSYHRRNRTEALEAPDTGGWLKATEVGLDKCTHV